MYFAISIFTFCFLILISHYLSKSDKFKFIDTRKSRFATIDGLRGYLATAVFFHHYIITWYWANHGRWERPPEAVFENYGKVGVAIFFMITGFLFVGKLLNDKGKTKWIKLYESRLFRIVPLYTFAVIVVSFVVFASSRFEINVNNLTLAKQYFRWVIFHGGQINDFQNTKIVIAGVDWTLKYEWLFYFSLPLISLIMVQPNRVIKIIALVVFPVFLYFKNINILSFSSIYLILFMIGGLSQFFVSKVQLPNKMIKSNVLSVVVLVLAIMSICYPRTLSIEHIVIISFFFVFVALGNDMFGIFSSKPSRMLGEISYSIYLLHGIVIYLMFTYLKVVDISNISLTTYMAMMPIVGCAVIFISSVTYLQIEKPSIDFGRRYILSSIPRRMMILANKSFHRTR